jgi:Helix-turn-helix domain of resolvase
MVQTSPPSLGGRGLATERRYREAEEETPPRGLFFFGFPHLIKARTDDGRKRAKARGVRFGRPRKLDQHQRQKALQRLANGETLVDVARTFGVDPTTIGRLQSPFVLGSAAA